MGWCLTAFSVVALTANAQDAMWRATPNSNDWNTNGNWTPNTAPTAIATFDISSVTSLRFSASSTSVNTLKFNSGAPGYTFTLVDQCSSLNCGQTLNIQGAGIINNSAAKPTFSINAASSVVFRNSSSAGDSTIRTVDSKGSLLGNLAFLDSSTAANASITNGAGSLNGGSIEFGA